MQSYAPTLYNKIPPQGMNSVVKTTASSRRTGSAGFYLRDKTAPQAGANAKGRVCSDSTPNSQFKAGFGHLAAHMLADENLR
jgi:hypothetical protein